MLVALVCFSITSCARLDRTPIPIDLTQQGKIPGMNGVRTFAVGYNEAFQNDLEYSFVQEAESQFRDPRTGEKNILS